MARRQQQAERVRRVRWRNLRGRFIAEWQAGEHVAIVGPTGSGKSTIALELLHQRARRRDAQVLVLATKRRDPTLAKLRGEGWPVIHKWPPRYEDRARPIILWPNYPGTSNARANRPIFAEAIDGVVEEGGWTIYFDEAIYFTETLGMRKELDELWNTARSSDVTVIASSQGTTWVPRPMLSQQSWVFGFRAPDEDVRDDLGRIMGNRLVFRDALDDLRRYEFLLVRTLTTEAYISKVGT